MDDRPATINDEVQLRGLYEDPMELALLKQLDRLDDHCRNFIAHAPFVVIGSTRQGRGTDVSPRGDAPGFVRVLDANTIAIPDRPGNNRLDTMSNIVTDSEVGLLFFIPGIDETLRINGRARL
jgi:PPOX class probable FMN-dependent enzyme